MLLHQTTDACRVHDANGFYSMLCEVYHILLHTAHFYLVVKLIEIDNNLWWIDDVYLHCKHCWFMFGVICVRRPVCVGVFICVQCVHMCCKLLKWCPVHSAVVVCVCVCLNCCFIAVGRVVCIYFRFLELIRFLELMCTYTHSYKLMCAHIYAHTRVRNMVTQTHQHTLTPCA